MARIQIKYLFLSTLLLIGIQTAFAQSVWNGTANTAWYNASQSVFTITTAEQLAGLAKLVNSGNDFRNKTVKLGRDIRLNDTTNWQNWAGKPPAKKWIPIGTRKLTGPVTAITTIDSLFNGKFDGNGFIVSGVYINSSNDYQGLFGVTNIDGYIENLGVVASYIQGKGYIGGLVGYNRGTINVSYYIGMILGETSVGGLVGFNRGGGVIGNSSSSGVVMGIYDVGGLVGSNGGRGTIINCRSAGTVGGGFNINELVGKNEGEVIESYSTSKVIEIPSGQ
jgi:hypothetical protein